MIVIPEGLVSDDIQRKYVQYQVIVIYYALSSASYYGLVLVEIIIIYCAFSSGHFSVTFSSLARNLLVTFEGYLGLSLVFQLVRKSEV
jgi:hypothetical protein